MNFNLSWEQLHRQLAEILKQDAECATSIFHLHLHLLGCLPYNGATVGKDMEGKGREPSAKFNIPFLFQVHAFILK